MMRFKLAPDGGESFEVVAGTRDILAWERTGGKGRTFAKLMDDMSMVELYRLAHVTARRTGQFTGSLTEFEQLVDLEFDEVDQSGAEGADPTNPAASTES